MRGADPFQSRRTTLGARCGGLLPDGMCRYGFGVTCECYNRARFGDATASQIGEQQLERP